MSVFSVITFAKGIQKLFPSLDTKDYYEIVKMCLDDSLPKLNHNYYDLY